MSHVDKRLDRAARDAECVGDRGGPQERQQHAGLIEGSLLDGLLGEETGALTRHEHVVD